MDNQPQPANKTAGVNLDAVPASTINLYKQYWWAFAIGVAIAIPLAFLSPILAVIGVVLVIYFLRSYYEKRLFQAFAASNGFTFSKSDTLPENGLIFKLGHSQHYSDVVTGTYKNLPFRLFIFTYTIGYGKNSQTFKRAVMALDFKTALPAFALRRHRFLAALDDQGASMMLAGYRQKLELEGDFDKEFDVYIVPGTQVEVLSILTPDVMQLLLSLAKFELELTAAGTFYIYGYGLIERKQDLIDLYRILEMIAAKIGADADRQKLIESRPQPAAN